MSAALALGLTHALVDAASLAVLYCEAPVLARVPRLGFNEVAALVILYNIVAFGLQAPLGLLADSRRLYRAMTATGLLLVAVAVAMAPANAWLGAVAVGLGNAMFHAGAGGAVLRATPGRAAAVGVFIGPGAAGVLAGISLGLANFPARRFVIVLLLVAAGLVAVAPKIRETAGNVRSRRRWWPTAVAICVIALLVSVMARSYVGGALNGVARTGQPPAFIQALLPASLPPAAFWPMVIVAAAVIGKMLGGLLADRAGWTVVVTVALAGLACIIVPAGHYISIAIPAMLLVQLTTAVTVSAAAVAMPSRPGWAFGLCSLALLAGAMPGLLKQAGWDVVRFMPDQLAVVVISLVTAIVGLAMVRRSGSSLAGR